MNTDHLCGEEPTRRRRWYQFGMRTLLLIMLLLAVGTGAWVRSVQRQQRAVQRFRDVNAQVYYDYMPVTASASAADRPFPDWCYDWLSEDFFHTVTCVKVGRDHFDVEVLRAFADLPDLKRIDLTGNIDGEELRYLRSLNQLRDLRLNGTSVTDNSLRHLSNLSHLRSLDLFRCGISDEGLRHIRPLTQLRHLRLAKSAVTGAGIRELVGMTKMRSLDLQGLPISDDDLAYLQNMTALEHLYLRGSAVHKTPVSDAGLAHLTGLKRLKLLHLDHSMVGSEAMRYCASLPSLERLHIRGTLVDDVGLKHLESAPALRRVHLGATPISNRAISEFQKTRPRVIVWMGS
jgi:hypothetical protein